MRLVAMAMALAAAGGCRGDNHGADTDAAAIDAADIDAAAIDGASIDARDAAPPPITRYDYAGNGRSSILVGDDDVQGVDMPIGAAYLYGGGLTFHPWTNTGYRPLGNDVAMVEDFSGDGLADLVMGDKMDGNVPGGPGTIYVHNSSTNQTERIIGPFSGLSLGAPISSIGDIDGDGKSEFAVGNSAGIVMYAGATRTIMFQMPGFLLPGVGDIDGDGAGDIPYLSGGRIYVVAGDDRTTLLDVPGTRGGPVGDVNHDGHPDVVVVNGAVVEIRTFVAGDVAGQVLTSFTAAGTVVEVARFGDLDMDNTPDVLVNQRGSVAVYSGATGALLRTIPAGANSITGPGDQNSDGRPDIVIGCVCHDAGPPETWGRVTVYSGADGSVLFEQRSPYPGGIWHSHLGIAVSSGF